MYVISFYQFKILVELARATILYLEATTVGVWTD
jgi:hypothetical protein